MVLVVLVHGAHTSEPRCAAPIDHTPAPPHSTSPLLRPMPPRSGRDVTEQALRKPFMQAFIESSMPNEVAVALDQGLVQPVAGDVMDILKRPVSWFQAGTSEGGRVEGAAVPGGAHRDAPDVVLQPEEEGAGEGGGAAVEYADI